MDHMNSTRWRTSSYSGGNGGECVQVAATSSAGRVLVRDSKDPDGPVLALTVAEWCHRTNHVKHGRFSIQPCRPAHCLSPAHSAPVCNG